MPQYFFHIQDNIAVDKEGLVLTDENAAKQHAEYIRNAVETELGPHSCDWKVQVTDASGVPIFEVPHVQH